MKTKKESLDLKYARFVAYRSDIVLPLLRSYRPKNDLWIKNESIDGGVFLDAE